MSRALSFSIGLGAAVAFPATAPPGSILLGEAGPIVNHVALVGADGVPVEVVPAGGGFVPSNDNLTDLGDATHRFRTLWLGTSIRNTSSLEVLLDGGTVATFGLRNPTTAQGVLLEVDGDVRPRVAGVSSLGSVLNPWLGLALAGGVGSAIVASGDLAISLDGGATRTLSLTNPTGGQVASLYIDGTVQADGGAVFGVTVVPLATNTVDLGLTGNRFRTLYLGTKLDTPRIERSGDITVDLLGAGSAHTFDITCSSGGAGRADLSVQGFVQTYGPGILLAATPSAYVACNGVNASLYLYSNGNGTTALRDPANAISVIGVTGHGVVMSAAVDAGGAPVINRPAGVVTIPNGSTSIVVTNDLVTNAVPISMIHATIQNATTNPVSVLSARVSGANNMTITLSGDPGASGAEVAFLVLNTAP